MKRLKAGFTLVEILVVLGIIAILAAILLAVFSRVRESGGKTVCQSNMRQIALAIQQYVGDNNGHYPSLLYVLNKNTAQAKRVEWGDAISPYIRNTNMFLCPSKQGETELIRNYGYNWQRLNVLALALPLNDRIRGAHEAILVNAATIPLNIESAWQDAEGNYHYGDPPFKTSCGRSFSGSTVHSGGANYSFVDGHVKWLTPQQMGEIECKNGPLPFPFTD